MPAPQNDGDTDPHRPCCCPRRRRWPCSPRSCPSASAGRAMRWPGYQVHQTSFTFLSDAFLKRAFNRFELLSQQLNHHVVEQGVLGITGHELFHRLVAAIMKEDIGRRILDLAGEVLERDRAWRRVSTRVHTILEHLLKSLERQILLDVIRVPDVGCVLEDQLLSGGGEADHLLEQWRVSLVEKSLNEHRLGLLTNPVPYIL